MQLHFCFNYYQNPYLAPRECNCTFVSIITRIHIWPPGNATIHCMHFCLHHKQDIWASLWTAPFSCWPKHNCNYINCLSWIYFCLEHSSAAIVVALSCTSTTTLHTQEVHIPVTGLVSTEGRWRQDYRSQVGHTLFRYLSSLNHKTSLWTSLYTDYKYHWVHLVSWPKHYWQIYPAKDPRNLFKGLCPYGSCSSSMFTKPTHYKLCQNSYIWPPGNATVFHAPNLFALQAKNRFEAPLSVNWTVWGNLCYESTFV